jgi:hypothetical protein
MNIVPSAGFEPAIPAMKRFQTRAATGIGNETIIFFKFNVLLGQFCRL